MFESNVICSFQKAFSENDVTIYLGSRRKRMTGELGGRGRSLVLIFVKGVEQILFSHLISIWWRSQEELL